MKKSKIIIKIASSILAAFLLGACKQIILIQEVVQEKHSFAPATTWQSIFSLFDWTFFIGFIFFISLFVLLWHRGYLLLEWIASKHASTKTVIIFSFFAFVFALCNIPIHRHGIWFAFPVAVVLSSFWLLMQSLFLRFKNRWSGHAKDNPLPEYYKHLRNTQLLAITMLWIWSCGWMFYFIAIEITRYPSGGAEVLFRSALCSLLLFAGNIDSTLLSEVSGCELLRGFISCAGIAAVVCTATLILNMLLLRVMAYMHLKHILINNDHNHLYLFFGMNDASKQLAESICNDDSRSVFVYVESNIDVRPDQNEEKTDGWKSIVTTLAFRRRNFTDIENDNRHALAIASCSVCQLEKETSDVLGNIGLTVIKRLLGELSAVNGGQLHVFFLSEDRDSNVRATCILANDNMIGSPCFQTIIYCHARRNGVNRIIEDLGLGKEKKTSVKILDSSYLAMEYLKRDVKNHPVSFVDIKTLQDNNPGAVGSEFVCLVMGFGETGQEAVNFLYEYGAFVDEMATEKDSFRSPFSCHVVDNRMTKLEGPYIAGIPGISCTKSNGEKVNKEKGNKDGSSMIHFYPYDYRSDDFYTKVLAPIVKKLNYVVVAIGNDELNMTVAVEILRYVRKNRDNLDKFCIYVRAYEKGTFKYINDIANHYNIRLRKDDKDKTKKIVLFGRNDQICTYNLIVEDEYLVKGKLYYETYRSLRIDPENDEGTWEQRRKDTMEKTGNTKWERMTKIKRKEGQDRSNALHAQTKMQLLEKAVGTENMKDFALKVLDQRTEKGYTVSYPQLSGSENLLMLNLAMCEHLRWNAAHEILGYVTNTTENKCNDLKRRHNCLKPWQQLDKESDAVSYINNYKLFDFGVVETTFKLEYKPN
jgi:hypothetical protein